MFAIRLATANWIVFLWFVLFFILGFKTKLFLHLFDYIYKGGNQITWEELYLDYSDAIYNYIFLLVGNHEVAEDLTHDTYVKVKHSLKHFRDESSKKTWLFSIARNTTYDFLRRKKIIQFVPFLSSDIESNQLTPVDYLQQQESASDLYAAIKQLKIPHQEVIILRYIHELSIEETATILNWSISKVKSKTFIAMKKLKAELLRKGGEKSGLFQ